MTESLQIKGAVLERSDAPRPYADSQPLTISDLELTAPWRGRNPRKDHRRRLVPFRSIGGQQQPSAPTAYAARPRIRRRG